MAWVKRRNSAKGVRWAGVYKDGDSERTAGTFVREGNPLLAAEEAERRHPARRGPQPPSPLPQSTAPSI